MSREAPDIREQEDCPSAKACGSSCDQHSLYLGVGIDRSRCAACAAYPALPCAVHRVGEAS